MIKNRKKKSLHTMGAACSVYDNKAIRLQIVGNFGSSCGNLDISVLF